MNQERKRPLSLEYLGCEFPSLVVIVSASATFAVPIRSASGVAVSSKG
jgi:hypothetical protein